MEFDKVREMYCEMEKKVMLGEISKHPFQFSPSSSSTSSSSSPSQYKGVLNARSNSQWPAQFFGDDRMTNFNNIGLVDLQTSSSHGTGDQGNFKAGENVEREHMFNKVVTPSDVGKLNRLVIPKQHAEKYFPLDSTANEKGLLLNFEDRGGKLWRFRYSYWNSSQSYVMTKGWSRFVKEKKLDAGDIVSFERGLGDLAKDRLFIDWKRRLANASAEVAFQLPAFPWGSSILMPPPSVHMSLQQQLNYHRGSYTFGRLGYNEVTQVSPDPVFHLRPAGPQGVLGGDRNEVLPMVFRSVPVVQGNVAAAKRLRLFGVNLECPTTEDADGDVVLSSTISQARASSLSPQLPSLQLRLFNGAALPAGPEDLPRQGKALSLDLDI